MKVIKNKTNILKNLKLKNLLQKMSYSKSTIVVRPSSNMECRYCHATDHVKGHFDKRTQEYVTTCKKLIAKTMRRNSLRCRAISNSHRTRQSDVSSEGFTMVGNKFSQRATSPGPTLKSKKQQFAFSSLNTFNALDESPITPIPTTPTENALRGIWSKRPNVFSTDVTIKPTKPAQTSLPRASSSPTEVSTDSDLKNKKRLNRITQLKAEIVIARADLEEEKQNATNWADEGDIDDARILLECLEEKLVRLQ